MGNLPKKLDWTDPAMEDLNAIWDYYEVLIGLEKAEAYIDRFFQKADRLVQFPEMGAVEEELSNAFITVRYLLEGHYKIYYKIDGSLVKILRVFDSRQSPALLRNR